MSPYRARRVASLHHRQENPLACYLHCWRSSSEPFKGANASSVTTTALREAARVAAGFQYVSVQDAEYWSAHVSWDDPTKVYTRTVSLKPLYAAEMMLAAPAMDIALFGHPFFAMHDLAHGVYQLELLYGREPRDSEFGTAMMGASAVIERDLQGIQNLALALAERAMPGARSTVQYPRYKPRWHAQGSLQGAELVRVAAMSGLIEHPTFKPQYSRLDPAASTSEMLRGHLGLDALTEAYDAKLASLPDVMNLPGQHPINMVPRKTFLHSVGRKAFERLVPKT
jgi:hypothetical protein